MFRNIEIITVVAYYCTYRTVSLRQPSFFV